VTAPQELTDLSLRAAGDRVAARETSSAELVEAALARIGATDAALGAFLAVVPERAKAAARAADAAEGQAPALEEVLADLQRRDEADSTRAVAPLRKAADAVELDSSDLDQEAVVAWIVAHHRAHP
jgi:cytidylate kinase